MWQERRPRRGAGGLLELLAGALDLGATLVVGQARQVVAVVPGVVADLMAGGDGLAQPGGDARLLQVFGYTVESGGDAQLFEELHEPGDAHGEGGAGGALIVVAVDAVVVLQVVDVDADAEGTRRHGSLTSGPGRSG
ncbi:MAG: hypothetical protein R3F43_32910 [bacterium]